MVATLAVWVAGREVGGGVTARGAVGGARMPKENPDFQPAENGG